MSTAHRHKIANKQREDLDLVFGDDAADQANTILNALSAVSKGGGEIAQKVSDSRKAAASAATLKDAQQKAQQAHADALNAQAAAMFETDQNGDKHQKAAQALVAAQMADQRVAALMAGGSAAAGMPGGSPAPGGKSSGHAWYFWPAIIGGVALGGAVIYRMVGSRGTGATSRYQSAR